MSARTQCKTCFYYNLVARLCLKLSLFTKTCLTVSRNKFVWVNLQYGGAASPMKVLPDPMQHNHGTLLGRL